MPRRAARVRSPPTLSSPKMGPSGRREHILSFDPARGRPPPDSAAAQPSLSLARLPIACPGSGSQEAPHSRAVGSVPARCRNSSCSWISTLGSDHVLLAEVGPNCSSEDIAPEVPGWYHSKCANSDCRWIPKGRSSTGRQPADGAAMQGGPEAGCGPYPGPENAWMSPGAKPAVPCSQPAGSWPCRRVLPP